MLLPLFSRGADLMVCSATERLEVPARLWKPSSIGAPLRGSWRTVEPFHVWPDEGGGESEGAAADGKGDNVTRMDVMGVTVKGDSHCPRVDQRDSKQTTLFHGGVALETWTFGAAAISPYSPEPRRRIGSRGGGSLVKVGVLFGSWRDPRVDPAVNAGGAGCARRAGSHDWQCTAERVGMNAKDVTELSRRLAVLSEQVADMQDRADQLLAALTSVASIPSAVTAPPVPAASRMSAEVC